MGTPTVGNGVVLAVVLAESLQIVRDEVLLSFWSAFLDLDSRGHQEDPSARSHHSLYPRYRSSSACVDRAASVDVETTVSRLFTFECQTQDGACPDTCGWRRACPPKAGSTESRSALRFLRVEPPGATSDFAISAPPGGPRALEGSTT
jgi:hypothetical protein